MIYALYGAIVFLIIAIMIVVKFSIDKSTEAANASRQLNELRANYQKMEYTISTLEKKVVDLTSQNSSLQNELETLMANPMVNSDKINKRIKK